MYTLAPCCVGLLGIGTAFFVSACLSAESYPGDRTTGTGGQSGELMCSPEGLFNGSPVNGVQGKWIWVDVPEAKCRDGSSTGFGLRLSPESKKLLISFGGTGACFNLATCNDTAFAYSKSDFDTWTGKAGGKGIFDTTHYENAFKDWNVINIPYCTGDFHSGNVTKNVFGLGPQSFFGYKNVGLFLQQIVPTFPEVTEVAVVGMGAGGFGATFNFHRIAQAFCPTPAILINDSGPFMGDAYLAPCLQYQWRDVWGMDPNFPQDCTDCTSDGGGGMIHYIDYLNTRYPGSRLALISSTEDQTVRDLYGFGQSNCAGLNSSSTGSPLPPATYTSGVNDLRTNHMNAPARWASYYTDNDKSVFLDGDRYWKTNGTGVKLANWVANVVNDGPMDEVGP